MKKICIVGMGYVGTTLGVFLAERGFNVVGVDNNPTVVNLLQNKKSNFHEKGLLPLLEKHVGNRLHVNDKIDTKCDVYIICVTTPIDKNKEPITAYVENAAKEVAANLKKGDMVIMRSTVAVGVTRSIVIPILEKSGLKCGPDFHLVFAPERTLEGRAIEELQSLPQVLGAFDEESANIANNFFRKITPTIINVSSIEAAEIIKILDNTYRDIRFAYANEIALLCESLDLDAVEVIRAANIGYERNNIPVPSPGVGGACLSKDPYILLNFARSHGYEAELINLGRTINEHMPLHVVNKLRGHFEKAGRDIKDSKIFVIGFAFKGHPETSDTRESPTMPVINELKRDTQNVYGYDPVVPADEIRKLGAVPCSVEEGFRDADGVIIMTNHESFKNLKINSLLKLAKKPCILLDSWHMLKSPEIRNRGDVIYSGVGVR